MTQPPHHATLLLTLLLLAISLTNSTAKPFKCTASTAPSCQALIDYTPPNSTTLSSIKTLFSIKHLHTLLGANNLPVSTSPNRTISAQQIVKIPFPCMCANGTGISDKTPVYVVKPGDGLDYIARTIFSALVTYQEIAAVNGIPDPDKIDVGQEVKIPLPCSCDEVAGERVVHYGHVVASGSTLELIAAEYGTSKSIIMSVNEGVNDTSLLAGQVLDVPLQACNSSINTDSMDYPLLVPNATYVFTANNCIRCQCNSANNMTLQCEPSGMTPSNSTWSTCPSAQCDKLSLTNTTTDGCNTTTCAYSGFNSRTILTTLATASTCPVNAPGPGNYGSSIGLSWKFLFMCLHLIFLCVNPL
ncbi:lysM domain-containing GPI-anchored protein 2 [Mercurialis annua]|uniref:lysM domain-containing GPI-anchored protein 2 n=1 Tax=Mercurialis annua TaxID=3986 RepID=UPI002160C056|nr:lysM domain-containing GPI-anchored protein 2 [Mercurialis annua]